MQDGQYFAVQLPHPRRAEYQRERVLDARRRDPVHIDDVPHPPAPVAPPPEWVYFELVYVRRPDGESEPRWMRVDTEELVPLPDRFL